MGEAYGDECACGETRQEPARRAFDKRPPSLVAPA
jgi:hypothetical protein